MKAIFPCKGTIILNKQDIEPLEAYYKTELIRSKMYEYYKTSKDIMQVGPFTYIPQNTNIVLDKSSLLELQTLKNVLNIEMPPRIPISKHIILLLKLHMLINVWSLIVAKLKRTSTHLF